MISAPIIAVIDNSIEHLSLNCLNYFAERTSFRYTYHIPSFYGIESLRQARQIDGMIILGSNSNVSDRLAWQKDLATFVLEKLEQDIPTLGICFGHQLIADAFGAQIDFIDQSHSKRSGCHKLIFEKDYISFSRGEELSLGYAHTQEIKTLPDSLEKIASSKDCDIEMIIHKKLPFWGVQGHPESDRDFMKRNMTPVPGKDDQQKILDGGDKILKAFLSQF